MLALIPLLLACVPLQDELHDCQYQRPARALVEPTVAPDFELELTLDALDQEEPWEDGGKVLIQAWDCVDLAWWNPAQPQKIVQIWIDQDECEYYEDIEIQTLDCDSTEGADAPYRDYDGDGITAHDGDPDDQDPDVPGDRE